MKLFNVFLGGEQLQDSSWHSGYYWCNFDAWYILPSFELCIWRFHSHLSITLILQYPGLSFSRISCLIFETGLLITSDMLAYRLINKFKY